MFRKHTSLLLMAHMGLLAALAAPGPELEAQLVVGAQGSVTEYESEGAAFGFGGRAMLGVPLTGLFLQASSDIFRRDCDAGTCWHQEMGGNLLWSFPLPGIVKPYVGGGVTLDARYGSNLAWSIEEFDINLLGGAIFGGAEFRRFRPFIEGRYTTREGQLFFTGGLLLYLF